MPSAKIANAWTDHETKRKRWIIDGLRGNSRSLYRFYRWPIEWVFNWLNRRGGKRRSFSRHLLYGRSNDLAWPFIELRKGRDSMWSLYKKLSFDKKASTTEEPD